MRRFFQVGIVISGLAVSSVFAHAHHSQAGVFDSRKTIEITGVVKSVSWRNPHGQILLAVKDEKGVETIWDAETASISILRNRGVDGSPVRVGRRCADPFVDLGRLMRFSSPRLAVPPQGTAR